MSYQLSEPVPAGPLARAEAPAGDGRLKVFVIRLINFVGNELVAHLPSYRLRHAWYRRVLGVRMGEGAAVHLGCYVWFYGPGQIRRDGVRIGSRTRINRGCCLDVRGGLDIGTDVSLSRDVMVLTAYHRHDLPGFPVETKPVVIEDKVWVGVRAIVLPGVRLGHGCVVAAGSVVTRDVAPGVIVAGVPARPVGARPYRGLDYTLAGPLPLFE